MSSPQTRLLHIHIPKTAGTSLRLSLQAAGELTVFPHYDEALCRKADANEFDVFSGHFGYETAAMIGGRMITVLRDPVDRFVSVYFFWRQLHREGVERNRKTALAVNYELHDFAHLYDEQMLTEEFHNRATWQIASGSSTAHRHASHDRGTTDRELLDQALQNLASFAAVGFQDNMGPFMHTVGRLAGRVLPMNRHNVTRARASVTDLPAATRQRIEDWVYLDIELMRQAKLMASGSDGA